MKSLDKTLDILEYLALQNGRQVTPSEAAEAIGLNLATTTRILGELTERGYLEKVSRKAGYRPGPMIIALANRDSVYHRLAQAAAAPITKLAIAINMPVNIAVMHGLERIMLFYSNPRQQWKPWNQLVFDDVADTATGRLLAAEVPENRVEELFPEIPCPRWEEVTSYEILRRELAKIRRDGYVCFKAAPERITVMGHLIRVPGYPPAAFGFGIRDEERIPEIRALSEQTAEAISRELANDSRIF